MILKLSPTAGSLIVNGHQSIIHKLGQSVLMFMTSFALAMEPFGTESELRQRCYFGLYFVHIIFGVGGGKRVPWRSL